MKQVNLVLILFCIASCKVDMASVTKNCCTHQNLSVNDLVVQEGDTIIKRIVIPNAFSPNGDGLHDRFKVHGYGIDSIYMTINNSYMTVYEGDQESDGWNGMINDELADEGFYEFKAFIRMEDESEYNTEGVFCLMLCQPKNLEDDCEWGRINPLIEADLPSGESYCE